MALSWDLVRSTGNAKAVRSAYIWLIVIPILVKALESAKNSSPILIEISSPPLALTLGLPFSWYILYLSALCFALGALVYHLRCPELIRRFATYSEFGRAGFEPQETIFFLRNVLNAPRSSIKRTEVASHFATLQASKYLESQGQQRNPNAAPVYESDDEDIYLDLSNPKALFWACYRFSNKQFQKACRVSFLFFLTGFLLLLLVAMQNFVYVVQAFVLDHIGVA